MKKLVLSMVLALTLNIGTATAEMIEVTPYCMAKAQFIVYQLNNLKSGVLYEEVIADEESIKDVVINEVGKENGEIILLERRRLIDIIFGDFEATEEAEDDLIRSEMKTCMDSGL